jgi:hypothetical protein
VIDSRIRSRRSGAILVAALFMIAAMPGLATAANTRSLFIGAPNAVTNDGKLFPTPVSVPAASPAPVNSTIFVVQIKSTDNQNISHTVLTVDWNAGPNTGLSLNTFFDPDGGDDASTTFCTPSGTLITCDYGSLTPALSERTIAVVVNVAANYTVAGQLKPLFKAQVTTNNENGSNKQLFAADSLGFGVGAFSDNGLKTFILQGRTGVELSTSPTTVSGAGKISTAIKFNTTVGEEVSITEGTSSNSLYPCPNLPGLSCQTGYSEVLTTSGSFSSAPYFKWTVTALVPNSYLLSSGFVVHYLSPTDPTPDILYFKNSSSYCPADPAAKIAAENWCIFVAPTLTKVDKANSLLTLTKFDKTFNQLLVEVVMDNQGGMKI